MIEKGKKITIKYFLNIRLPFEPEFYEITEDDKDSTELKKYYPLYFQITYNRKSTQLKCFTDSAYYHDINDIDEKIKAELQKQMNLLKRIVAYETRHLPQSYSLRGIRERYLFYATSLMEIIEESVYSKYNDVLPQTKSEYMRMLSQVYPDKIQFKTIISATLKLIPDFMDFADENSKMYFVMYSYLDKLFNRMKSRNEEFTILDWYDGSARAVVINFMNDLQPDENTNRYLVLIDEILKNR